MPLHEKIKEEMKEAMKARDSSRLETLRSIASAVTNELVATGKTPNDVLPDESVLSVIKRLVKQRKDSIEQFDKAGRADLVAIERSQLSHLEGYLPAQMEDSEVKKIIEKKKSELGITDKSKVGILVGAVMKEVSGQADGSVVKKLAEESFN